MKKSIFIVLVLISFGVQSEGAVIKFPKGRVQFIQQNWTINVEIARTKRQRGVGLMYRKNMAPNSGMLFVFEDESVQRVWMKNTYVSLDIIFVSTDGKVVSILRNIQPCNIDPCTIYKSTQQAKYMLEVNAGFVENKGIEVAETILFSLF